MELKARLIDLESGGKMIAVLNVDDAAEIGARSQSRVTLKCDGKTLTAIINTTDKIIRHGELGVLEEVKAKLGIRESDTVTVELASPPQSLAYVRNRLRGRKLNYEETVEIIQDVVEGKLSEIEIASFVTSLYYHGIDLDEATNLSLAMVETGQRIDFGKRPVVDKHSIGGVPGDKTTLLVVPIVAASGLTIPKSSSRAITSAAGTADRAENLMPVNLSLDEMRSVIGKTNACIMWGGTLDLSPADDIFIKVEFPLSIDPLLLPSIISKKKAVGSEYVVIDIPCGWGAKIKTLDEANLLARDFIELGRRLQMNIRCAITYGSQPIGYSVGPALEAKEALENLVGTKQSPDLIDKATDVAGILLDMVHGGGGKATAVDMLKSGKAEEKLRDIIEAQGGDRDVTPDDIPLGEHVFNVAAKKRGAVAWINNQGVVEMARSAGAPKDKGAGILLNKKVGDPVRKGETIFSIYAEKSSKLTNALKALESETVMMIGEKVEMLMGEVRAPELAVEKFILER